MSIVINHISTYLPKIVLNNHDLSDIFNVSHDKIFKNTGINKRYISDEFEIASDMAICAANKLFNEYKVNTSEIDLLIFCSEAFDYIAPSTSCFIQHQLGLNKNITCIDLPYGCSGYIYGLGMANAYLTSGMSNSVLFLTSDVPSKVIKQDDLELRSIFSDIATASFITKADNPQSFIFGTDGSGYDKLMVLDSGFRKSSTIKVDMPHGYMKMQSTDVFLFAVKTVPILIKDILHKNNCKMDDIDLFVFHQASYFMLEVIRKKCKIPQDNFFMNIENYGNSVSSSIPNALYDAYQKGVLKKGMKVLLAGFGIGYSWGATVIKY